MEQPIRPEESYVRSVVQATDAAIHVIVPMKPEGTDYGDARVQNAKERHMLGMIAVVLIVLWLLGFFVFHVTTAFIHVVLVVGAILLVLHFLRR